MAGPPKGVLRRLVDGDGFIMGPAWNREAEPGNVVGSCRQPNCGGVMVGVPTHIAGAITWYGARCLDCGSEIASPSGRTLPGSARHWEMPEGAWVKRQQFLEKLASLGRMA